MTYTGELRVSLKKWNMLMAASPANVGSQWNNIASIIHGVIFSGKVVDELPVDVVKLLKLLEKWDPENFGALPQHPALKDEVDTLAQFSEIYMELLQVKKNRWRSIQQASCKIASILSEGPKPLEVQVFREE
jgi:hypothetical protein